MIASVTREVALAASVAVILKIKLTIGPGLDNTHVKIYEMRIVHRVALGVADPMWIVASVTGRIFSNHMFIMNLPLHIITHIGIKLIAHVAGIAQFVGKCRFRCIVNLFILIF